MSQFRREERYIVVKIKDAQAIDQAGVRRPNGYDALRDFLQSWHIPTREALVIEKDWPEYEAAWAMIERRMTGRTAADFTPDEEPEQVGDCGKWAAYINDESHRTTHRSAWFFRIRVLGETKEDAEALRDRVLVALNAAPAPAPVEWNGEGLPPPGTVCELRVKTALGDWSKAHIKFASRNVVVWDWDGEPGVNGLCTSYVHSVEMCPIRTPEQIEAEERGKAIDEMYALIREKNPMSLLAAAAILYDANYRKQVAP